MGHELFGLGKGRFGCVLLAASAHFVVYSSGNWSGDEEGGDRLMRRVDRLRTVTIG